MLLFVYGTLRKGFSNHYLLDGATFVGDGKTVDNFYMVGRLNFELDEFEDGRSPPRQLLFPYIFKEELRDDVVCVQITGELYEVSDGLCVEIDKHEGHPGIYKRTEIDVIVENRQFRAATYILESPEIKAEISDNLNLFVPIGSGDWRKGT
jgi:gamma-glutamylaminecyclotransferase